MTAAGRPVPRAVIVNGHPESLASVATHTTALEFPRGRGLTGGKEVCAEGECGACAILVARPGVATPTEWVAVNACLVPVAGLDRQEVVTAEGLGTPAALHPVQVEMVEHGGSQCGYCTPGFVCSMAAEYYRPDRADGQPGPERGANGFDLHALSGNLCRCTGYRSIRDAAFALGAPAPDDSLVARLASPAPAPVVSALEHEGRAFVRPATLTDAVRLLHDDRDTVVVAGGTDWGVDVNLRGRRAERVMAIDRLPELRGITATADRIEIGAATTFTEIERRLDGRVPLLAQMLPHFASRLIRNTATLGGNLGTGSSR
ncbi:FAD binding domain-containing protein [Dactylosporangium cerinum]|uniref:FAD binding domain-containing protein n=1 Tax=Dactylosporangium cerinum TaxID=1434730 RepID=A0ABV9W1W5_9ACTN